jgi:TRAP-type transport system large permease protein
VIVFTFSFALIVLILLGAPIGITMAALPAIYIAITRELPLSIVPYQMYDALSSAPLIAVPFFILTGELMNSSQITERLMILSRELVGRIRGGMAQMNVLACMLFAGMNGSAVADTATIGGIMIPAMKKAGYSAAFAAAQTAVAATIGGIVPPSIVMIVLAGTMGLSVGALWAAGIAPGILVGVLLMAVTYYFAWKRNYERYRAPFRFLTLWRAFWGASPALVIPGVIVGGILFSIFSPTEAGAATVIVAAFIGIFVYRSLRIDGIASAVVRSVRLTSSIFIILAASGPFSWFLNRIGALQGLDHWLTGFAGNPPLFSLILIGLILVVGTVIETIPAIVILGPTLIAACKVAGFHELQASLVIVVGFLMGAVHPPVGVCYFTASYIAKVRPEQVAIALIPFMLVEVLVMFLILVIPGLTLTIPGLMGLTHG